jgi:hypothetical protein
MLLFIFVVGGRAYPVRYEDTDAAEESIAHQRTMIKVIVIVGTTFDEVSPIRNREREAGNPGFVPGGSRRKIRRYRWKAFEESVAISAETAFCHELVF